MCPLTFGTIALESQTLPNCLQEDSAWWWAGPEWLGSEPVVQTDIEMSQMPEPCSLELKSSSKTLHNLLFVHKSPTIGELLCSEEFSDLQKLYRVTANVLRAVNRFQAKRSSTQSFRVLYH